MAIEVKEISFSYPGNPVTAVENVSMKIEKGERVAIIGQNGAGKSTVMSILSRLIAKDEGVVEFEGKKLEHWKSKELSMQPAL